MGQDNCKPQPGDLIEIDRPRHQHWALYVGHGYVIHLTPVGKKHLKLGVHTVPVFTRKVKKELLEEVAGNNTWCINNKSDQNHTPLPVEEIIQRAEGYIGKELTYRVFGSNCEHFVKNLRSGGELRAFIGGELNIPHMTDEKDPKPGDLIEIEQGYYQHWALYVGDGYVIHVAPVDEGAMSLSASSGIITIRKAKVTKELLDKVAENNDWAVNNQYDCHRTPLPVEEIILRAEGCIGKELPYNLLGIYSEDFVTKLRYGGKLRAFVGGELNIPHVTDEKDYPKPGDLIEIEQGYYKHWALYVGDGYVVHVAPVDEGAPSLSASSGTILSRKAKVTKELLDKVAENDAWAVNNQYDCHRTPLPVEEIIWRAEGCIGRELPYDVIDIYLGDFVTKLRYGGKLRAFFCDEMHLLGMTEDKNYPNPGDLIEVRRPGYQHWALYLGKGFVIHVTDVGSTSVSSSSSGSVFNKMAKVKKELLKEVTKNDAWAVNNKYDHYRTPFPMEEIIRRAEPCIDKELPYRLFFKNCEHFVTMLRYGEGVSWQASKAVNRGQGISSALAAGLIATSLAVPTAPVLTAAGASFLASIGFTSSNVAHIIICAKFKMAGKDILEKTCC